MKLIKVILSTFCFFVLTGCAISSAIEDADKSESKFDSAALYNGERTQIQKPIDGLRQHRIFHQGSSSFTPVSAVRNSAMSRVTEFCGLTNMTPYLIEEATSKPPHILGNFPRVEIVFSCVNRVQRAVGADKYDQVAKIKRLLDGGAITEAEYKREKRKILGQ